MRRLPPPPSSNRTGRCRDRSVTHDTLGSGGLPTVFTVDLSQAPLAHVSTGPPAIPDGRFSRVRFWPRPCTQFSGSRSSHAGEGLSDGTRTPASVMVHLPPRSEAPASAQPRHCVRVRAESSEPPSAQSPFACRECYPRQGGHTGRLGRRYSPFIARTGSCASPTTFHGFRFSLCLESAQVAAIPCWLWDLPDIISVICVEATGPIPRRVPRVRLPISSPWASASRYGKHVRHTRVSLPSNFRREPYFEAAVIRSSSVSPTR
jgi:hypothetical protein